MGCAGGERPTQQDGMEYAAVWLARVAAAMMMKLLVENMVMV